MTDISKKEKTGAAVDVVIMAAGKGTRMKSKHPKVLHLLAGRALLQHVVDTAAELSARQVVVITGHGAVEVVATVVQALLRLRLLLPGQSLVVVVVALRQGTLALVLMGLLR